VQYLALTNPCVCACMYAGCMRGCMHACTCLACGPCHVTWIFLSACPCPCHEERRACGLGLETWIFLSCPGHLACGRVYHDPGLWTLIFPVNWISSCLFHAKSSVPSRGFPLCGSCEAVLPISCTRRKFSKPHSHMLACECTFSMHVRCLQCMLTDILCMKIDCNFAMSEIFKPKRHSL
jgi:hypothetical protein